MRLGQLGIQAHDEVVTPLHEAWLKTNFDTPTYSSKALDFASKQLASPGRVRTGSYSASSLGGCKRQQQLTWLGYPKTPLRPRQIEVARNGTYMHLRWQMAGISAGWLSQPEVAIPKNAYGLRGTMDGILTSGEGLELKSANSHAYAGIRSFGIKHEHDFQIHTYMLATGIETFCMIYENKDNQEWHEIVRHRDEKIITAVKDTADLLLELEEREQLYPMIEQCEHEEGWRYDWCEYRKVCPMASWQKKS
jgi:hypothetical protein